MRKAPLILLAVVLLGIAEAALLGAIGRAIGFWPLLGILALETAIGGWIVKAEGAKAWRSLSDARRDPVRLGPALSDAALILVGALLLILPGFLTDAVGLLFLLPPTRSVARRGLTGVFRAVTKRYRDQAGIVLARTQPSTVVEGEASEVPRPGRTPGGSSRADATRRPDDDGVVRGEILP